MKRPSKHLEVALILLTLFTTTNRITRRAISMLREQYSRLVIFLYSLKKIHNKIKFYTKFIEKSEFPQNIS